MSTLNKKAEKLLKSFKVSKDDQDMMILLVEKVLFNQHGDHLSNPYIHKCTLPEFIQECEVYHSLGITVHTVINSVKGAGVHVEKLKKFQPRMVEVEVEAPKRRGRPSKETVSKND